MKLQESNNIFRKVQIAFKRSFSASKMIDKFIEGVCIILAFALAAKFTSNLDLFIRLLDEHTKPFLSTLCVSVVVYPLLLVLADIVRVIICELLNSNSTDHES